MAINTTLSTSTLLSSLAGKINLLIVDDEETVAATIGALFDSPFFSVVIVRSYSGAIEAIDSLRGNWHAWIIDIDLGSEKSGIDIIKAYDSFPCKIVFSGLRSMGIASEAMELGVKKVVDKDPDSLTTLFEETCRLSTLGFLLRGRQTKYFDLFSLLENTAIRTTQDWAHHACITPRQLSRICELHGSISPHHFIAHYHTVNLLLRTEPTPTGTDGLFQGQQELMDFYAECVNFSTRHCDDFSGLLKR